MADTKRIQVNSDDEYEGHELDTLKGLLFPESLRVSSPAIISRKSSFDTPQEAHLEV